MTPVTMLDAALKYALRGWHVFPLHTPTFSPEGDGAASGCSCGKPACKSIGKHPRTATGLKEATNDVDQIRKWWTRKAFDLRRQFRGWATRRPT